MSSEAQWEGAVRALPVWIAADAASQQVLELVRKAASLPATVLIAGESGTGKDQLAQLLHFLGPRRHKPVVKIDCASLPAELLESELFGYEKGAFTGAYQAKPGRLELAGEGTLILDEIASLSLPLQAKLLRVIEEKSFERLGGHTSIQIEARLVALTNVELAQAVERREFREDLYYRLFVLPVPIPPLRERRDDILPLAEHFLTESAHEHPRRLSATAKRALVAYDYPGNARELRNLLSRAVIFCERDEIGAEHLPAYVQAAATGAPVEKTLAEVEKDHIAAVLQRFRGRKQAAAAALGISAKTLLEKRRKYGLDPPWTDRLPPGIYRPED
ncbi:MAG: sigma-54-dependent Fis family transcriptional regulator [Acidobacteria bacterium]|nr:MAG: sigma-54-dependent Fis family transcriptional regulator [Acidobacteriota bacterium]